MIQRDAGRTPTGSAALQQERCSDPAHDHATLDKTPVKDLYELGEIPARLPCAQDHVRLDRAQGAPRASGYRMQVEVVPTWEIGEDEVLVLVMAAGVNYNGVWAALGEPMSVLDVHKQPYHVAGSDASGIVWKVGSKVRR